MPHDEFSYIREWTRESQGQEKNGITVGIGDDAAVISVSRGMEMVVCCDTMIETVHFLRKTMNPYDIGYKAVISNVSDVAAMGGIPLFALVSIGVPSGWSPEECKEIYDGIYAACNRYQVRVIGGDTVSTPDALHLTVMLLGEVEAGRAIRRSGAKPGHVLFVTGTLGDSAAGLHFLLGEIDGNQVAGSEWHILVGKHQRPEAQVEMGRLLLSSGAAGALNDVSDGLASELWEIADASGVHIRIEEEKVPISHVMQCYAAQEEVQPLKWAFFGGEDYQLVGTIPAEKKEYVTRECASKGINIHWIGRVEAGEPSVSVISGKGEEKPLPKGGYNHFQR